MKKQLKQILLVLMLCAVSSHSLAKELTVMISGGFKAAWEKLEPQYAAQNGNTLKIKTVPGPSMGQSAEAIPNRLAAGEKADVVIMVGYALDNLAKEGKILPGTRTELADSKIGAVVKAGNSKPDISSNERLSKVLLSAKSIAYSDSASGRYVQEQLFKTLGIEQQVAAKAHKVEKMPVGETVARGQYEIGFQQVSELLPISGVAFIGKIPDDVQYTTRFAGAVAASSASPAEAKALLNYLSSKQVQPIVQSTGLDTVAQQKTNHPARSSQR